jgi:hypothetical protein
LLHTVDKHLQPVGKDGPSRQEEFDLGAIAVTDRLSYFEPGEVLNKLS